MFFFWIGNAIDIQGSRVAFLYAILLGHVALSLPYVIFVVGARLNDYPKALEEAAATLGATPWQALRRVSVPILAPVGRRGDALRLGCPLRSVS